MNFKLINGNSAEILKQYPDNHFDSIVTDPPYGISFLGKDWDKNTGEREVYEECLRVLKPGGHILAFSAARTYHHLAMTLEQVGFEIRDQIMWIYSSGFPKSQDVGRGIDRSKGLKGKKGPLKRGAERMINQTDENGNRDNSNGVWANETKREPHIILPESDDAKQWSGWGTSLKPAHEPICMARKPMKNSVAKNVQEWGTGAINVDACRIECKETRTMPIPSNDKRDDKTMFGLNPNIHHNREETNIGRFPNNVLGEIPDYQKYFYCPKVSRKERHLGFDTTNIATNPNGMWDDGVQFQNQQALSGATEKGNNHPTVKPVELMKYLIKLITPKNGKVLDPFNGSGSTGMAAVSLGHHYTGIDLDEKYIEISKKRIEAYNSDATTYNQFFSNK